MNPLLSALQHKIQSREEAVKSCHRFRMKSDTIVFTNGCFDILHAGHIHSIAAAKSLGTKLVVGINSDASVRTLKGEGRPVQNEESRVLVLAALAYVDIVVVFGEETPLALIKSLNPDILVKGGDYSLNDIVGAKEVLANGGRVEIIPILEGYSTTAVVQQLK